MGVATGWVLRGLDARADRRDPSYHFIGVQVAEPAAFAAAGGVPSEVRTLYPALMLRTGGGSRVPRRGAVLGHRHPVRLSGDLVDAGGA